MPRWEYKILQGKSQLSRDIEELDKYGRDGWEAYAATNQGSYDLIYIKRRIDNNGWPIDD